MHHPGASVAAPRPGQRAAERTGAAAVCPWGATHRLSAARRCRRGAGGAGALRLCAAWRSCPVPEAGVRRAGGERCAATAGGPHAGPRLVAADGRHGPREGAHRTARRAAVGPPRAGRAVGPGAAPGHHAVRPARDGQDHLRQGDRRPARLAVRRAVPLPAGRRLAGRAGGSTARCVRPRHGTGQRRALYRRGGGDRQHTHGLARPRCHQRDAQAHPGFPGGTRPTARLRHEFDQVAGRRLLAARPVRLPDPHWTARCRRPPGDLGVVSALDPARRPGHGGGGRLLQPLHACRRGVCRPAHVAGCLRPDGGR